MADIEAVVDGLSFTEGPRWHDGRVWFSDMHDHRVLAVDEAGAVDVVFEHDGPPSGLGWTPDGRLLISSMEDARVIRLDPGGPVTHGSLRELASHDINDMVVDAEGRAYVSQLGYSLHTGGRPGNSPLLVVEADGTPGIAADDMAVANGLALTADGATLVVAESAGCRLTAFTVDDRGKLVDRRVFAALEQGDYPDGICLDAEGAVWVACPVSARFVRVLEGGHYTDTLSLPEGRRAIACVLGGSDRRSLYLCTATTLGNPDESRAVHAARLERIAVEVPGAGTP